MPALDMPLDQLKTYQGKNPRPADFDAYWDRALAELKAIDPKVELTPAPFSAPNVECFDLWFTGTRNARVHAKYVRPAGKTNCPAVCMFHGYSGSSGSWNSQLNLVASGFCVAALDVRGQAGQSEDPGGVVGNTLRGHIIRGLDGKPDDLFYRDAFLDTARLADIVMSLDEVDASRVGAMGVSQGGGLTLACAALEPRIRKAAPVIPFLTDYYRTWEMDLDQNAYEELRLYFRAFDPKHERETEIFTRLGYIDTHHLAPRIEADVWMGVTLLDNICPPSTQFAAYNHIPGKKRMSIYPDFTHEFPPQMADEAYAFLYELA